MERTVKGIWIPITLWDNEKFKLIQKFLLAEIDSLNNGSGCFASNEYFAKFANVHERTISRNLNDLIERKFVKTWYKNNKRYLATIKTGWTKSPKQQDKMSKTPDKMSTYNNSDNINSYTKEKANEIKKYFEDSFNQRMIKLKGINPHYSLDPLEIKHLQVVVSEIEDISFLKKMIDYFFSDKISDVFSFTKNAGYNFKIFNHKKSVLIQHTPKIKVIPVCPECGKIRIHHPNCSVMMEITKKAEDRREAIMKGRKLAASLDLKGMMQKSVEDRRNEEKN